MSRYVLAVDAGGTKTDLLLADETEEIARVRTGSIKVLTTAPEVAARNLAEALAELEAVSGVSLAAVSCTCVGASGFSVPRVAEWLRAEFGRRVGGALVLCGDEEIAFDAAFAGGRGVLVLAGTGSNVMARTAAGELVSAGGWGPVLGDEGSGHWIGLEAVRSIFRARDAGRATMLLEAVLRAWQLNSERDLVQRGNSAPAPVFAELTPAVVRCAAEGDAVACAVLESAGEELARLAETVIERVMLLDGGAAPAVAVAGSVLGSIPAVFAAMADGLRARWPEIAIQAEAAEPLAGALWRARASLLTEG
jgi:N-acetylglucosamine kinase-like BadF-type ATPase